MGCPRWDEQQVVCPPLIHRVSAKSGKLCPESTLASDYLYNLPQIMAAWEREDSAATDLEIQELRSIAAWRARRVQEIAQDIQSRPEFLALQASGNEEE